MQAAHILIVDDEAVNRLVLKHLLGEMYQLSEADNAQTAWDIVTSSNNISLILLDIMLPGMNGFELCQKIKQNPETQDISVLFISGLNEPEDETRGFAVGAEDFIHKPFSCPVVSARVRNHVQLAEARRSLLQRNLDLESLVQERTQEILRQAEETQATQASAISAFCALAEARDNETGNHIRRTQHYVKALAECLQHHPRFAAELRAHNISLLFRSAPLHDIGKVAIPDQVLYKPGKHTPEEWAIMQRHAEYGRDAILRAEAELGHSGSTYLRYAREIAYCHHEKWDGSGYPQGLVGEAIPLSARLMAAADVYDALISKRVYKPAFSHEKALAIIAEGRGTHFDPDVADAVATLADTFKEIAQKFNDEQKED